MLQQGFMTQRRGSLAAIRREYSGNRSAKFTLWTGVTVLFTASLMMLMNFSEADRLVAVWTPFVIAGTVLVFVGSFLRSATKRK